MSELWYLLPVVTSLLAWLGWRIANRRLLYLAKRIPGPPGLPLLGNALDFIGSPHKTFMNVMSYSEDYEDVAKMWLGPRFFVFLTNPLDIEVVLSSKHIDKAEEYTFMKPWMGEGLLLSTGKKWYSHRKVIAQTFHVHILRSFMNKFNENSRKTLKRLAKEVGREFDVRKFLCQFTAETLLATVMGTEANYDCADYSWNTTRMSTLVHARQTKIYLRPDFLFHLTKLGFEQRKVLSVIHGFSHMAIHKKASEGRKLVRDTLKEENREELQKDVQKEREVASQTGIAFGQASGLKDDLDLQYIGGKKQTAFLDTLIEKWENNEIFTLQDVQDQFDTVMFEGHDTTASLTSLFLCMMAIYQDIQEKVYEELERIFGDSDRDVTFQDTLEMKYLERCLMETMRVYSPVPVIARKLNKELKIVTKDIVLPANCTVIIGIYKLHRRPDVYPNPEKFNPDNFLPENTTSRNFYSFIPFSAGLRSCVGRKYAMLKAKTILATILRNFKVTTDCPEETWKLQADITLKRTDGSKIKLTPRRPLSHLLT